MQQPTALALSQFFTALTGKQVSFSLAGNAPDPRGPCMYAVYTVLPENSPLVMRISLKALAVMGAALLGLPEDSAFERAQERPEDETMRDAMHEVLNIASTVIGGSSRVVFKKMYRDMALVPPEAVPALKGASLRSSYKIALGNTNGELTTIYH